jgi:myo-inositol-1(or 4)-monophosphatase
VGRPPTADLLAVAREAAQAGADVLRDRFGGRQRAVARKSSPTDVVGEADLAAERSIRAVLADLRPADALLAEESGASGGDGALRWVVDPLDGTVNFLYGLPQYAVSVAVEDGEATLAGVVLDVERGEEWSATSDGPALHDGEPVRGSERDELGRTLVATGFGYDAAVRAAQGETVARLLPHVRDVRRAGSAALDLAWTAAGRHDAYYERGVQPWDVAAGALICARAGLEVRTLPARPPQGAGILVAPAALVDVLTELVG